MYKKRELVVLAVILSLILSAYIFLNLRPRITGMSVFVQGEVCSYLFIRGDIDKNGIVNTYDSSILNSLFIYPSDSPIPSTTPCWDAGDVNDDEEFNVTDRDYLSNFLSASGPEPPAPYHDPGVDEPCDLVDNDLDGKIDEGCDLLPIIISIISPLAQDYSGNQETIQIEFKISVNRPLDQCEFSLNLIDNTTMTMNSSKTGFNYTENLGGGQYNLTFYCRDSSGHVNLATTEFSTSIEQIREDKTPPNITIHSPINQVYLQSHILFNISIDESGGCSYSLDDNETKNMQPYDNFFISLESVKDGTHNITFFCNDTSNNLASSSRLFTANLTEEIIFSDEINITTLFPRQNMSLEYSLVNYRFRVVSEKEILVCALELDDKIVAINPQIDIEEINVISFDTKTGNHSFSILCIDIENKTGISKKVGFEVSLKDEPQPKPTQPGFYSFDEQELSEGVLDDFAISETIQFILDGEEYFLNIDETGEDFVILFLSPSGEVMTLKLYKTKEIDLNEDGINDLRIGLVDMRNDKARLRISKIPKKEIPEERLPQTQNRTLTGFWNISGTTLIKIVIGMIVFFILIILIVMIIIFQKKSPPSNAMQPSTQPSDSSVGMG